MGVRLQAVGVALAEDDAERVVIGDEIVRDDPALAEVLARPARVDGARSWLGRVVEEAAIQVLRVGPDVLEIERRAAPELTLEVEAPLVFASVRQLARRRNDVGSGVRAPGTGRRRCRKRQRRVRGIRRVGRHRRHGRVVGQERERVHLVRVEVDAEAGPHHGLLTQTIGGADPRGEVLVVRLVELESRHRIRAQAGAGNNRLEVFRQHRRHAFIGLHGRVHFVAQPNAQREISRSLPHVVDEESVAPPADVTLDLIGRRNDGSRQSEHEVGHRDTRP